MPYVTQVNVALEGKGLLMKFLRKKASRLGQTRTVTSVSLDSIADSVFVVPTGWKLKK